MNCREKLIELIQSAVDGCARHWAELIADKLLDNGVTFATDTNDACKWICVTEDMPELIPCSAGTAYSEAVNVLTSERIVLTAIWNGVEFISDCEFWEAEGQKITHWAPVPLPLPEPPEEGC